jgi:hypothetical protein
MSNAYYIKSADNNLVFDIKVPVASGSPLQALVQKNEANQHWTIKNAPWDPHMQYFYIMSGDNSLVIDIKMPVASGSPLQALVEKKEANQLWKIETPGKDFSPSFGINVVFDPALGFVISGSGWFPGSNVSVTFNYTDKNDTLSTNRDDPTLLRVDLGGCFGTHWQDYVSAPLSDDTEPGNLSISVTDTVNNLSKSQSYTYYGGGFLS